MQAETTNTAVTPDAGRVEALDLLRLAAVFGVMCFHFCFYGPELNGKSFVAFPEWAGFAKYGYLGVQLFFVISGFVIAYSAVGRNASTFAIARFSRIYPAFFFCMTL
ncbi:MAG: acyltransferase family protein, partial [Afipia sp.]|nr:acyltransferase family protein [Afipia sp.]